MAYSISAAQFELTVPEALPLRDPAPGGRILDPDVTQHDRASFGLSIFNDLQGGVSMNATHL